MEDRAKIKINDNINLRHKLYMDYCLASKMQIAKWSIDLAKHILVLANSDDINKDIIQEAIEINLLWQNNDAKVNEVRQASLRIHKLARESKDEPLSSILRVVGHSIATGHMKEHGMVASDYAIKCINLAFPNDNKAVIKEREWQIKRLLSYIK